MTAHVKLLAVLRKIAESVYAAAALAAAGEPASQHETLTPAVAGAATAAVAQSGRLAGGGGGGSSKALWLLGALDHWLLELAVGEVSIGHTPQSDNLATLPLHAHVSLVLHA